MSSVGWWEIGRRYPDLMSDSVIKVDAVFGVESIVSNTLYPMFD